MIDKDALNLIGEKVRVYPYTWDKVTLKRIKRSPLEVFVKLNENSPESIRGGILEFVGYKYVCNTGKDTEDKLLNSIESLGIDPCPRMMFSGMKYYKKFLKELSKENSKSKPKLDRRFKWEFEKPIECIDPTKPWIIVYQQIQPESLKLTNITEEGVCVLDWKPGSFEGRARVMNDGFSEYSKYYDLLTNAGFELK